MRNDAITIFQAGIEAADPYAAVQQCLQFIDDKLIISLDKNNPHQTRRGQWRKIHLLACGKAAVDMMKAAYQKIPESLRPQPGLVITNYENVEAINHCVVLGASHPLPNEDGLHAAKQLAEHVDSAQQGELVLFMLSGGGSALAPYPLAGISLEDKTTTTNLLLGCGANINDINCVRKHLSTLKGGGLAKLAPPADLHTFVLSDVIGDDLSSIASGPTVADNSRFEDAIQVLKHHAIWDKAPASVQNVLINGQQGNIAETPDSSSDCFNSSSHTLVSSNRISVDAIEEKATALGYATTIYSHALTGEAKDAAEKLVLFAKQHMSQLAPGQKLAILAGGETTVTLTGDGLGGRNQEMSLAFALAAQRHQLKGNWVFLSGGTDGRDGPTNAAGGVVDPNTLDRIDNAEHFLANNDSYHALQQSGDLLITGATGTNVADLQVLLCKP